MRAFNFSPGPAALPLEVLLKAQSELVEHEDHQMSVMEMSHRSPMYQEIIEKAADNLRKLTDIPDEYDILFLQGGASMQFAMVPLNLMKNKEADYAVTGSFAKKAAAEAGKYLQVNEVASSADRNFCYNPIWDNSKFNKNADYFHITTNNTIYGTSCRTNLPNTGNVPLVADMSSNILSEKYDVTKFGLIYAGAQKNIGPAGLTIVIIRKDLISSELEDMVPSMLRYDLMAKNGSMYNTPSTYAVYIAGLVFENLLANGGVETMEKINLQKAELLYNTLDASSFFKATADKDSRSIMNVTFVSPSPQQDAAFIQFAKERNIFNIKGHRSVGGMRASIYNAVTLEAVTALCDAITAFENAQG